MDINGMLIWAAVLVSLIVFIVLLVKCFASWGLVHTILLSILFIECWTFIFLSANVAYQRLGYTKALDSLTKKMDKLQKEFDLEMFGDRWDPKLNLEKFTPLTNELNRLLLERGRVWRGAVKQGLDKNGMNVLLPVRVSNIPDAAAAGAAAATAVDPGLAIESVVYIFGETRLEVGVVPIVYIGEFAVSAVKEAMVTVRPTTPLTKMQEAAASNSETWSIYEIMPIDSHTAFAAPGASTEENAIFGFMKKEDLAKDLGIDPAFADKDPNSFTTVADVLKARVLQSYVNDGARAPEKTPPEALAYEVTFLKDYTLGVDSPSLSGKPLEGGFFDSLGNAIDARLRRDAEQDVVYKVDETAVFDEQTANELQRNEIVKLGPPVFVRPLNDYNFAFRELNRMTIRARQDTLLIEREIKEVVAANNVAAEQEIKQEEDASKRKLDKAQYSIELEVIRQASADLGEQIQAKRAELSKVYSTILSLHERLIKHQRDLAAVGASLTATP